jgi:hypothetical protein
MKIADGVGGGERVLLNTTKSTQSSRLGATPKARRAESSPPFNRNYLS